MSWTIRHRLMTYTGIVALSTMFVLSTLLFSSDSTISRQSSNYDLELQHHRLNGAQSIVADSTIAQSQLDSPMKIQNECAADIAKKYKERQRRLVNQCRHMRKAGSQLKFNNATVSLEPFDFRYIFVDDAHKVLYCSVPKVASTNWKRVMLMLTGQMNVTHLEDLKSSDVHHRLQDKYLLQLNRFKPDEIRLRLDTYFKFMFVRHPLERVVSAYENKLATLNHSYFQTRLGRSIIRKYRPNASKKSLTRGHDVTFSEFVRYLGDYRPGKNVTPLDAHWRPYSELCLPCLVRYDVIGKYETMAEDATHIIDVITKMVADVGARPTLPNVMRFPKGQPRTNRTHDVISRFDGLRTEHIRRLNKLYFTDFKLFSYEYQLHENGYLASYHSRC